MDEKEKLSCGVGRDDVSTEDQDADDADDESPPSPSKALWRRWAQTLSCPSADVSDDDDDGGDDDRMVLGRELDGCVVDDDDDDELEEAACRRKRSHADCPLTSADTLSKGWLPAVGEASSKGSSKPRGCLATLSISNVDEVFEVGLVGEDACCRLSMDRMS